MSNDALDDTGMPLTAFQELHALNHNKPIGFGPRYETGDGLTDGEFAERIHHLDQLSHRKYEQDREWAYFGAYEPYRGKVVYGPTQGPWRGVIPASWRME